MVDGNSSSHVADVGLLTQSLALMASISTRWLYSAVKLEMQLLPVGALFLHTSGIPWTG